MHRFRNALLCVSTLALIALPACSGAPGTSPSPEVTAPLVSIELPSEVPALTDAFIPEDDGLVLPQDTQPVAETAEPSISASARVSPSPSPSPTARASATPKPTKASAGSFSKSDLTVSVSGVSVKMMSDSSAVLKKLGKNYKYHEMPSCDYVGLDKSFTYSNIMISTVPSGKKDLVMEINIKGGYKTSKGIGVGSTKDQVIAAYGDDYKMEGNVMTYYVGGKPGHSVPKLYFEIGGDKVKTVNYYAAGKSS